MVTVETLVVETVETLVVEVVAVWVTNTEAVVGEGGAVAPFQTRSLRKLKFATWPPVTFTTR